MNNLEEKTLKLTSQIAKIKASISILKHPEE
jgi:hypothetical protein